MLLQPLHEHAPQPLIASLNSACGDDSDAIDVSMIVNR